MMLGRIVLEGSGVVVWSDSRAGLSRQMMGRTVKTQ